MNTKASEAFRVEMFSGGERVGEWSRAEMLAANHDCGATRCALSELSAGAAEAFVGGGAAPLVRLVRKDRQ